MYSEHAYNIRVVSFYYLKRRYLVNRLPLDNATISLKLQHHGVGRRLAHRKDKRCVFGTMGPRSRVNISDEKLFGQELLLSGKMRISQLDAAARSWRAVSHRQKQLT